MKRSAACWLDDHSDNSRAIIGCQIFFSFSCNIWNRKTFGRRWISRL